MGVLNLIWAFGRFMSCHFTEILTERLWEMQILSEDWPCKSCNMTDWTGWVFEGKLRSCWCFFFSQVDWKVVALRSSYHGPLAFLYAWDDPMIPQDPVIPRVWTALDTANNGTVISYVSSHDSPWFRWIIQHHEWYSGITWYNYSIVVQWIYIIQ